MTHQVQQKFDGLAEDYDRYRPRYPDVLLDAVARHVPSTGSPCVVDAGAGTGIALEGLIPRLPRSARIIAMDKSTDMVARGLAKYPSVTWEVGAVEPFLEQISGVDLVLAAQAYQWMDRPRYLTAAAECLSPGGWVAILQNNRDFAASAFLDAYESLLEELSPGYSRHYRSFDIATELRGHFETVSVERATWEQKMPAADFIGMSRSSTQAQRALAADAAQFTSSLRGLTEAHQVGHEIAIAYVSELFLATTPRHATPGVH